MSAQTRYNYSTPIGAAGFIVDLAPHAVDTFLNEENTGKMLFGVGVVQGTDPGTKIKLPATGATAATFEGITTNNHTTEYDMEGNIHIIKGAAVGVMRYGRIYARVATGVTPAYGDKAYMLISGDEAGYFTNVSGNSAVAIKGRFLGTVDTVAHIAQIELFNEAQS